MVRRVLVSVSSLPVTGLILTTVCLWAGPAQAQQESGSSSLSPPKNATFTGLTKCAACHFDQYKDWKESKHSRAFEILPAKYRNDATCLKCHTTGTAGDVASYQYGVSCQACHGPGSEHAEYGLRFVNERISEAGLKTLREKIQRLDLHQCVDCHISKAHKKHPPYDGQEALRPSQKQSASFFGSIHGDRPGDADDGSRRISQPAGDLLGSGLERGGQAVVGAADLPSGRLIRLDFLRGL
jgi:hypothetical protein